MKVYIAGPMCFRTDYKDLYNEIRVACESADLTALIPTDNVLESSVHIFQNNIQMINDCDFVIANLSNYIGKESDSGTCVEIGYAFAKGKTIFGYYEEEYPREYKDAVGCDMIPNNCVVEDFGLSHNLMVYHCCNFIVCGDFSITLQMAVTFIKRKNNHQ